MSTRVTRIQKVRRRIRDAIKIAEQRGFKVEILSKTLDFSNKTCDPLGAVIVANFRLVPMSKKHQPEKFKNYKVTPQKLARLLLGLTRQEVREFLASFRLPMWELPKYSSKIAKFARILHGELTGAHTS